MHKLFSLGWQSLQTRNYRFIGSDGCHAVLETDVALVHAMTRSVELRRSPDLAWQQLSQERTLIATFANTRSRPEAALNKLALTQAAGH